MFQNLLIDLMRQEGVALQSGSDFKQEVVKFKVEATLLAIRDIDQRMETAKNAVQERIEAKKKLQVCMSRLPALEERAIQAREKTMLLKRSKDETARTLSALVGK